MARTWAELTAEELLAIGELVDNLDNNSVIYKDSSGNLQSVALGTLGQVFTSNGISSAPTFEDASGGGAGVTTEVGVKDGNVIGTGTIGRIIVNNTGTIDKLRVATETRGNATLTVTLYKNGASIGTASILTSTTTTNGLYQIVTDITNEAIAVGDVLEVAVTTNTGTAWNNLLCSVDLA